MRARRGEAHIPAPRRRYGRPVGTHRQALGTRATIGALLAAVAVGVGGCGGSAGASSTGTQENAAASTPQTTPSTQSARPSQPPPPAGARTPQQAVRDYLEGIHTANGAALCNLLDVSLQRSLIQKVVSADPIESGESCVQALTNLAASVTTPGERRPQVPPLQVTVTGSTAVVTSVGLRSHRPSTYRLVKHGSGWLIDRINDIG
jgi:hypothetical protein